MYYVKRLKQCPTENKCSVNISCYYHEKVFNYDFKYLFHPLGHCWFAHLFACFGKIRIIENLPFYVYGSVLCKHHCHPSSEHSPQTETSPIKQLPFYFLSL